MYSTLKYALAISGAIVLTVLGSGALGVTPSGADAHGPRVEVTSKYITDAGDYTLAGSVRGYADLKELTVTVNGGPEQTIPLEANFKLPVKLKPGQNEILLKTLDKTGHSATNMVVITLEASGQGGVFSTSQSALASWQKMQKKQMKALRKALAKEPAPAATQSTAESLKALNKSAAELKKTLASLGASTVPTPESEDEASTVAKKKSPPEKRIDNTPPLINITSPTDAISVHYLLAGSATDDTGVSRLTISLNDHKPEPLKLDHGRFKTPLELKHGANLVRVTAADALGHTTVQRLRVTVRRPTSSQLIDAAVKNGELDRDHALLYKVFAAFGNPRLPLKYKGDDSRTDDDHVLDEAAGRFWSLPRKMQRAIIPYFIPPYYIGSKLGSVPRSGDQTVQAGAQAAIEYPVIKGHAYITPAVYRVGGMRQRSPASRYSLIVMRPQAPGGRSDDVPIEGKGSGAPPCVLEFPTVKNCVRSFKWHYLEGKHVRIWYADYRSKYDKENVYNIKDWVPLTISPEEQARKMLNAVEGEKGAWNKLTTLMGKTPISDKGHFLNGGNGKLDIALNPGKIDDVPTHIGLTITYLNPRGDGPKPVFIVLQRDMKFNTIKSDVAHELMHAIQWTYHTQSGRINKKYSWLMESTAVWAQNYVFPEINWEHHLAAAFIKHPQMPLESDVGDHEYWSYLFFFFLTRYFEKPNLIRLTWEATTHEPTGIDAAVSAIKKIHKKLDKTFPVFTVYNLNDGPIDSYINWDGIGGPEDIKNGIDAVADYEWTDVHLDRYGSISLPFFADGKGLAHLSARHFAFSFKGVPARSVAIFNGYGYKLSRIKRKQTGLVGSLSESRLADSDVWAVTALPPKEKKGRHLEALVNIDHEWKRNGRDGKPYANVGPGIAFCSTSSDKHIDALILVASNSRMPGKDDVLAPRGDPPLVYASNMGCGPWKGTIEANDDGPSSDKGQWTFTTEFTTGTMGSASAPITTEGQVKKASAGGILSSGAGDLSDLSGFLFNGTGKAAPAANGSKGASVAMGWPTHGRYLPPFGAILSFGTGVTHWSAEYPNCGRTNGEYKNLILVVTYNFVRSGDLYRHYMLMSWPAQLMSMSMAKLASASSASVGLPYRVWDPESKSCDLEHRDPPGQPFLGTMENDGVHAQGSVSGPNYESGDGSANYYFHLQEEAGKG